MGISDTLKKKNNSTNYKESWAHHECPPLTHIEYNIYSYSNDDNPRACWQKCGSAPHPQSSHAGRWQCISDGVMGGLSAGTITRESRGGRPAMRVLRSSGYCDQAAAGAAAGSCGPIRSTMLSSEKWSSSSWVPCWVDSAKRLRGFGRPSPWGPATGRPTHFGR